jgi:hypothetical protein
VVDGEGTVGELPHASCLPLDALCRLEDGVDASEAACLRYRRNQLRGCRRLDRRLHEGNLDAQGLTYRGAQHRSPPIRLFAIIQRSCGYIFPRRYA